MAISITVDPWVSPRIIEIPDTLTDITVQEIVDAVRGWEDSVIGMNYAYLLDAAGKEDLGGGVKVELRSST